MRFWIIIFLSLVCGEITARAQDLSKIEASFFNGYLHNVFGLSQRVGEELLFQPHILASLPEKDVLNLKEAQLIYFDDSKDHFIPSSYGDDDLVVVEDSQDRQWEYGQFQRDEKIKTLSFRTLQSSLPLGKSLPDLPFSLRIVNRKGESLNPLNIPEFPLKEIRSKSLVFPGILLESGIYTRYVHSNKPQRIPLRKSYSIYVYVYEKTEGDRTRALPRNIQLSIRDLQKQSEVLHSSLSFDNIKNNKMNGVQTPSELYRKYALLSMIHTGTWNQINRMDNYEIIVTALGSDGEQSSFQFPLEFY